VLVAVDGGVGADGDLDLECVGLRGGKQWRTTLGPHPKTNSRKNSSSSYSRCPNRSCWLVQRSEKPLAVWCAACTDVLGQCAAERFQEGLSPRHDFFVSAAPPIDNRHGARFKVSGTSRRWHRGVFVQRVSDFIEVANVFVLVLILAGVFVLSSAWSGWHSAVLIPAFLSSGVAAAAVVVCELRRPAPQLEEATRVVELLAEQLLIHLSTVVDDAHAEAVELGIILQVDASQRVLKVLARAAQARCCVPALARDLDLFWRCLARCSIRTESALADSFFRDIFDQVANIRGALLEESAATVKAKATRTAREIFDAIDADLANMDWRRDGLYQARFVVVGALPLLLLLLASILLVLLEPTIALIALPVAAALGFVLMISLVLAFWLKPPRAKSTLDCAALDPRQYCKFASERLLYKPVDGDTNEHSSQDRDTDVSLGTDSFAKLVWREPRWRMLAAGSLVFVLAMMAVAIAGAVVDEWIMVVLGSTGAGCLVFALCVVLGVWRSEFAPKKFSRIVYHPEAGLLEFERTLMRSNVIRRLDLLDYGYPRLRAKCIVVKTSSWVEFSLVFRFDGSAEEISHMLKSVWWSNDMDFDGVLACPVDERDISFSKELSRRTAIPAPEIFRLRNSSAPVLEAVVFASKVMGSWTGVPTRGLPVEKVNGNNFWCKEV
jgi:hypothetical protein